MEIPDFFTDKEKLLSYDFSLINNYLNKTFDFEPKLKGTLKGDPVVVEYTPRIEVKE